MEDKVAIKLFDSQVLSMNIFTIIFYGNVMMSHMGGEEAEFNDELSWDISHRYAIEVVRLYTDSRSRIMHLFRLLSSLSMS